MRKRQFVSLMSASDKITSPIFILYNFIADWYNGWLQLHTRAWVRILWGKGGWRLSTREVKQNRNFAAGVSICIRAKRWRFQIGESLYGNRLSCKLLAFLVNCPVLLWDFDSASLQPNFQQEKVSVLQFSTSSARCYEHVLFSRDDHSRLVMPKGKPAPLVQRAGRERRVLCGLSVDFKCRNWQCVKMHPTFSSCDYRFPI